MFRQGDVLFVPRSDVELGKRLQPEADGSLVMAHGELTGHAHRIKKEFVAEAWTGNGGGVAALKVGPGGATVTHEEHKPVNLPEGTYEVRHQTEFDNGPVAERD
jgi:hypothetical protein